MCTRVLFLHLALLAFICSAQSDPDVDYRLVSTQLLVSNGGRVAWGPNNLIAFDALIDNGYYDIWTMNPDGSNQICLTCGKPNAPIYNKGNPDWHPSGNYLVMQAQRMDTTYLNPQTNVARPGAGADNVIYIMDAQGNNYWEVPDSATYTPHNGAVLHPHFSHDGTKLVWAQEISHSPGANGDWEIQVASFAPPAAPGAAPVVTLLRTLQPGVTPALYETHGFTMDDSTILFSGTASGQTQYGNDIYSYNLDTNVFTDLTNTPDNWDEHARPRPIGNKLMFASSFGNPNSSLADLQEDYWTMNYDGTDKKRMTWFQDPASAYYLQGFTASDNDWSPDGTQSVAYFVNTGGTSSLGEPGAIYLLTFAPSATATSSASYYNFPQAPGALVSSFGSNLAATTEGATSTMLPTTLGSTTVSVTDSQGVTRQAQMTFASAGQVNWLVPAGTAPGPAQVTFSSPSGTIAQDWIGVEAVGPGVYSATSTGSGPAAGFVNVYGSDGSVMRSQNTFSCPAAGSCATNPANIGGGQPYLILFGTGIANHQNSVKALIGPNVVPYWTGYNVDSDGATTVTATFAGAQGQFPGLDQVNVPLPSSLAGTGTMYVQLQVDGYWSNTVQVQFQ